MIVGKDTCQCGGTCPAAGRLNLFRQKGTMRRVLFAILTCLLAAPTVEAGDYLVVSDLTEDQKSRLDVEVARIDELPLGDVQRRLYAQCAPIVPVVGVGGEPGEAGRGGLTEEALMNVVESRLRAARLHAADTGVIYQGLHTIITLNDGIFRSDFTLFRTVDDLNYGVPGVARMWATGHLGSYSSATAIIESVSLSMDKFLAEYLRANEVACDLKWTTVVQEPGFVLGPPLDYDPFARE